MILVTKQKYLMLSVSFIVPVYNAENHLAECIISIQKQSVSELEIICIDDGSNDNSLTILESIASKDVRVRIIKLRKNLGVGHARNIGIENAKGRYVRMVDSDDFIPLDSTEKLLSAAIRYGSDAVRGGFWHCNSNGNKSTQGGRFPSQLLINGDFEKDRELWYFDQHWTYLFKREVINKAAAKYNEKMKNGQDVAFMIQLIPYLKTITLIPYIIYFYRKNALSTMRSVKNKAYYLNLFTLYEMEYDQLSQIGYSEQVDSFMLYHLEKILPQIVFPSIPQNLQKDEAIEVFSKLEGVVNSYGIDQLCFKLRYPWQSVNTIPLLTKQIILLISHNHLSEAYDTLHDFVQIEENTKQLIKNEALLQKNKNQLEAIKNDLSKLKDSTSWKLTFPVRKTLDFFKKYRL